ncbi:MAG: ATP-binding protein [Deltaproteobacteria bacterium]|nr:ATP-binding protein [Candidatus Anaeroferrophillus wilburensis]MBN2889276.1 ATP-binding protein [Deltaproteobacteria bacterium]
MDRMASLKLERWLQSRRRKPLVLRGARQVGKSTLVRNFAAQQKLHLLEINLERHLQLERVFASLDVAAIRGELEALTGRALTEPGSLLFLDEIQATPSALQALRYFYEDLPDVPVIAAGSLLEFTLAEHNFSMPVGRLEYFHLGPMSYREFLQAVEPSLCRYLDEIDFSDKLPATAHQKLLERQRQYLFVGGMPEAVLVFKESGSFAEVARVQRSIASTYEDDFAKYARHRELALLQRIFHLIPRQVGHKVKYVHFSRENRSREVKTAIDLLAKALVCHRVYASHCSGVPLAADIDEFAYKLLFLDVGLMNHLCGLDWSTLRNMDVNQLINEGAIAEQFVGQHLAYLKGGVEQPWMVYWLREGRKNNAEVDYVISRDSEIFPVEIKAGRSGALRSLHQFVALGKAGKAIRFDANQPSWQKVVQKVPTADAYREVSFELFSLPLYAVGELPRMLPS